jgi:uncharacterized repeat protein (TIGR02543 family)
MKKTNFVQTLALLVIVLSLAGCGKTVRFDSQGGSQVPSQKVETEKVLRPEDPVKTDYEFGGWYADKDFTAPYDFESPVNRSLTLYAKWLTWDEADFGPDAVVEPPISVSSPEDWKEALRTINSGGNGKNYVITITGENEIPGLSSAYATFTVNEIKVSLRGDGTLALGSRGALLTSAYKADQTLILRGPTLRGRPNNDDVLIGMWGGAFLMKDGVISGNNGKESTTAVGIHMFNDGIFKKTGGTIYGIEEGDNTNESAVWIAVTNNRRSGYYYVSRIATAGPDVVLDTTLLAPLGPFDRSSWDNAELAAAVKDLGWDYERD